MYRAFHRLSVRTATAWSLRSNRLLQASPLQRSGAAWRPLIGPRSPSPAVVRFVSGVPLAVVDSRPIVDALLARVETSRRTATLLEDDVAANALDDALTALRERDSASRGDYLAAYTHFLETAISGKPSPHVSDLMLRVVQHRCDSHLGLTVLRAALHHGVPLAPRLCHRYLNVIALEIVDVDIGFDLCDMFKETAPTGLLHALLYTVTAVHHQTRLLRGQRSLATLDALADRVESYLSSVTDSSFYHTRLYHKLIDVNLSLNRCVRAVELALEMTQRDIVVDIRVLGVLVSGLCEWGRFEVALQLVEDPSAFGLSADILLFCEYIRGLSNQNRHADALLAAKRFLAWAHENKAGWVTPLDVTMLCNSLSSPRKLSPLETEERRLFLRLIFNALVQGCIIDTQARNAFMLAMLALGDYDAIDRLRVSRVVDPNTPMMPLVPKTELAGQIDALLLRPMPTRIALQSQCKLPPWDKLSRTHSRAKCAEPNARATDTAAGELLCNWLVTQGRFREAMESRTPRVVDVCAHNLQWNTVCTLPSAWLLVPRAVYQACIYGGASAGFKLLNEASRAYKRSTTVARLILPIVRYHLENNAVAEAEDTWKMMQQKKIPINFYMVSKILSTCRDFGHIEFAHKRFTELADFPLRPSLWIDFCRLTAAMLDVCAHHGATERFDTVYQTALQRSNGLHPTLELYEMLARGNILLARFDAVDTLFLEMEKNGLYPDARLLHELAEARRRKD